MRCSFIVFCALLLACHAHDELKGLPDDPRAWNHVVPVRPGGLLASDARWVAQAQTLIDATRAVIDSPRFRQVLLESSGLHESAFGGTIGARALLAAYVGAQPQRAMLPADVTVADTQVSSDTPGVTRFCTKDKVARIRIQPYVLRQWATISIDLKACAINTLAHELAHTVADNGSQMFTDGYMWFARRLSRAVVSYRIGTIAQCVYLEQAAGLPRSAMAECLARGSANRFVGCPQPIGSDSLDTLREVGMCPSGGEGE